jgi:enoyl-CoA hydratase/carnithine racemase
MGGLFANPVLLERHGAVASITFNRPAVINAINDEVRRVTPPLLMELDADPAVLVIVVRGAGPRGFCVGADLKEDRAPMERQIATGKPVWIESFAKVRKPLIASIHGYCLGGGLEIALACDIRIASADASFGLPEPAVGLIPGGGGTQRLPRLIGMARALDLLLSAERIDAVEAYRVGLVSRITTTREQLKERTEELATRIATLAPLATRLVKEAAQSGAERGLEGGLQLENELFMRLLSTQDRHEAAAAFREKRDPIFKGS